MRSFDEECGRVLRFRRGAGRAKCASRPAPAHVDCGSGRTLVRHNDGALAV